MITPVFGDFTAPLKFKAEVDAVLLVCNTIFEAEDYEAQRAIFANAHDLLHEGDVFIVETINPLSLLRKTETSTSVRALTSDTYLFEHTYVEPLSQQLTTFFPVFEGMTAPYSFGQSIRLITPLEMDAIAARAGMLLSARMGWWDGSPASIAADRIISVHEPGDF